MRRVKNSCVSSSANCLVWSQQPSRVMLMAKITFLIEFLLGSDFPQIRPNSCANEGTFGPNPFLRRHLSRGEFYKNQSVCHPRLLAFAGSLFRSRVEKKL